MHWEREDSVSWILSKIENLHLRHTLSFGGKESYFSNKEICGSRDVSKVGSFYGSTVHKDVKNQSSYEKRERFCKLLMLHVHKDVKRWFFVCF